MDKMSNTTIQDEIQTLKIRQHLKYRLEAWLALNEESFQAGNRQITSATALFALGDCYSEELLQTEGYLKQRLGCRQ